MEQERMRWWRRGGNVSLYSDLLLYPIHLCFNLAVISIPIILSSGDTAEETAEDEGSAAEEKYTAVEAAAEQE